MAKVEWTGCALAALALALATAIGGQAQAEETRAPAMVKAPAPLLQTAYRGSTVRATALASARRAPAATPGMRMTTRLNASSMHVRYDPLTNASPRSPRKSTDNTVPVSADGRLRLTVMRLP